jgi:hypothetical protein
MGGAGREKAGVCCKRGKVKNGHGFNGGIFQTINAMKEKELIQKLTESLGACLFFLDIAFRTGDFGIHHNDATDAEDTGGAILKQAQEYLDSAK